MFTKGTTLLETLLSTFIFVLLVIAVFIFFDAGREKWAWMNLGRKLGNDARTAISTLERDLRRTNYSSVDIYTDPSVIPPGWEASVPRWAVCFVGSDLSKPGDFDPATGQPVWNKYIIYMGTTQIKAGGMEGIGGAGDGLFVRIVENFNSTAANPLPLHNPVFVPSVDWVNNNEFGGVYDLRKMIAAYSSTYTPPYYAPPNYTPPPYTPPPAPSYTPWPSQTYASSPPSPSGGISPSFYGFTSFPPTAPTGEPGVVINNPPTNPAAITSDENTIQSMVNTNINGARALKNTSVNMTVISDVFALMFTKNDITHTIGVTYKVKGYASRQGGINSGTAAGFESRQIDDYVLVKYYGAK